MQRVRTKELCKGEGRKEWIRVDTGRVLFLVRGTNGVKPLVESPQTKRIYPFYATSIFSPRLMNVPSICLRKECFLPFLWSIHGSLCTDSIVLY